MVEFSETAVVSSHFPNNSSSIRFWYPSMARLNSRAYSALVEAAIEFSFVVKLEEVAATLALALARAWSLMAPNAAIWN